MNEEWEREMIKGMKNMKEKRVIGWGMVVLNITKDILVFSLCL